MRTKTPRASATASAESGAGTYIWYGDNSRTVAASGDEHKVLDASGDFQYVVRDGEEVAEPQWGSCRFIVTSKRLVLAAADGKQPIPHSKISLPEDPESAVPGDVPAGVTALSVSDDILLIDIGIDDFPFEYCRATLQGAVISPKLPCLLRSLCSAPSPKATASTSTTYRACSRAP